MNERIDDSSPAPCSLETAPMGTKAPAIMGGHWVRVPLGWKWCNGATFPRPGGDWNGKLILPENASSATSRKIQENK